MPGRRDSSRGLGSRPRAQRWSGPGRGASAGGSRAQTAGARRAERKHGPREGWGKTGGGAGARGGVKPRLGRRRPGAELHARGESQAERRGLGEAGANVGGAFSKGRGQCQAGAVGAGSGAGGGGAVLSKGGA